MLTHPKVRKAVELAESVLAQTGVAAFCQSCIAGTNPQSRWNGVGCCKPCSNLGPTGCVLKPLSCAVWLCEEATKHFPQAVKQLRKIQGQFPDAISAPYNGGFRTGSLENEQRLVQIELAAQKKERKHSHADNKDKAAEVC